jgi:hypothetical protein
MSNVDGIKFALEALEPNTRSRSGLYSAHDAPVPENSVQLLQQVYKDRRELLSVRMRAAIACLPFEFPKLAATYNVNPNNKDFADLLAENRQRRKRLMEQRQQPGAIAESYASPFPKLNRRF